MSWRQMDPQIGALKIGFQLNMIDLGDLNLEFYNFP
jgi:hypothetical protein